MSAADEQAAGGRCADPRDPDFDRQMKAARQVMKKHRKALRELAG
jgi:hypothetical protein